MLFKFIAVLLLPLALLNCSDAPESTMADQEPAARRAPQAPDLPPPDGMVAEGAQWETLATGYVYTDGPAADAEGNVYYAEVVFNHLYKVDAAGNVSQFDENTGMTMGLVTGPDGLLYACRNHEGQIVRYTASGEVEVLLQGEITPLPDKPSMPGEFCNDLAINAEGGIWFTDRINRRVRYLDTDGTVATVAQGFRPNGIVLSADRKMLAVTDSIEPRLHAFSIGDHGRLSELPDFFDPVMTVAAIGTEEVAEGRPGSNGMTVDSDGRFYVASFYGIQVFDRNGSYVGVLRKPKAFISNISFGGPGYGWLYATGRVGIYRLQMQTQGVGW